jgi:chromosome segregation and condensation protein ScpB
MRHTAPRISTLYVKAFVRKTPTLNQPVAVRVLAAFHQPITSANAAYMREVSTNASLSQLQHVIDQLQDQSNALRVVAQIHPAVLKILAQ